MGKPTKLARRRACFARLLESLEPRLLLSSTFTSQASTGFSLDEVAGVTTLTYTDTSSTVQHVSVADGDTLSGGNGTVSVSEPTNTVSVAEGIVRFDGISLHYSTLGTANVSAGTTLTVTGTPSGTDAFTISSSAVAFDSLTVNYSGVSSVVVAGGGGTDTFAVNSTASGEPLTVNSNGTSTTTVGNGHLNNIASDVTVNNGTLTVNDTAVGTGQTGAMTATKLTGLDLPGSSEVDYAGLGALNVNLGAHGNTFTVSNTPSGATTTVSSGGGSPNTVAVQATTGSLTVNSTSGAATAISLGSVAPAAGGDLTGIGASVTVNGHSGDLLDLQAGTDSTARSVTVTGTTVTGLGMAAAATLTYGGVSTLGIHTGLVADTINARSTGSGTATTVTTGGGINTIVVGSTAPTLGGNTDGLLGALTIAGDNNDLLTIDNSGGSTTHGSGSLNGTSVSGLAPTSVSYGGIATLTLKLGTGDTLTVAGTHAGTTTNITTPSATDTVKVQAISSPTMVTTGGGGNTVRVSSAASNGNLDGIGALLTVNGSGTDSLTVDDSGSSASRSPALSGTSITAGPAVIHYSGQSSLTLSLGSASDAVTVTGTGIATTVNGGGGADTYNVSTGAGTLVLNTGAGNDSVNVKATGAATTVNAGAGTDAVVVGSNAPSSGGVLANVTGALTIAGGGATSLTLDDTGASTAKTTTISVGSATGLTAATISYSNLVGFAVNLGSQGNTVTLSGTPSAAVLNTGTGNDTVTVTDTGNATTVTGGGGDDQINVRKVSAAVTVNAGLGTDTVNVGSTAPTAGGTLGNIGFALTVAGDTFDTLNLDDSGDSSARPAATITNAAVTGLGNNGAVNYSGVGALNVNLGTGTNTLGITGTNGSATTTVNSKSGTDQISVRSTAGATNVNDTKSGASTTSFIVSSSAPTAGGTVNNIQGALVIVGASGGTDSLTVDDSGSTSAKTGALSSTAVTGLGMGASGIAYGNIKSLTVKLGGLGAAGDNFTIAGTSSFGSTTVTGGSGDDTINIQAIGGTTGVNAGAGNNTVNVGSNAPLSGGVVAGIAATLSLTGNPSKDVLNIDDSGDSSSLTITPSPTSVTIGSAVINYSSFSKVHIDLGANGSYDVKPSSNGITFNASSTTPTPVTVNIAAGTVTMGSASYAYAGFSNVTLIGQTFGDGNDPLVVNGASSAENYTLSANTVSVGSTTIAYSAFASMSIFGGGGADSFIVNGDATPTTITDGTSSTPGSARGVSFTVNNSNHLLTLVGGNGTSTFNVTGNSAALVINGTGGTNTFSVSGDSGSTSISGGGGALNTFNISGNSAQLTLAGHGTANNFSITGNSASLNATGGNGTDSFVISRTTAPINLQAGNGTTNFHVTTPTQASVTVAGGTTGNATLTFDGNFVADVFTLTGNTIQGSSFATLNYSGLKGLTVNGQGGADIFFVQGDTTPTTLNGANGPDIFNVDSFSGQLTINTVTASTVNLGNNQPLAGSVLNSLNGTVTVNGAGGDQLNIDDTVDANPQTVGIGATSISISPTTVNYANIGTVNLLLGVGGNTVNVTGTAAATVTNVNTGSGNDSINVRAVGGTTNINTGGGNSDPIIVGSTAPTLGGTLNGIAAPLNLTGSGTDALTLDDSSGGARTAAISFNSVAVAGLGAIGYSGMSSLAVNFGAGGNSITVNSTSATTQTTVTNAGAGNDTVTLVSDAGPTNIALGGGVNTVYVRSTGAATGITTGAGTSNFSVGSAAPTPGGVLDGIQGALTLGGGTGGSLTLDDTGSSTAKTGQLDVGVITGLGLGSSGIVYSGIGSLTINLGSGGDTLTVKNTDAATTVNGGSGSDTVTVQNDSSATTINTAGGNDTVNIQAAHGATTVNTGTGTDAVNIGSKAPAPLGILDNIQSAVSVTGLGGTTTLTLDDTGSAGAKTGNLTATAVTGLGMGSGVTYAGIGTLNVHFGSGGDTFTIASTNGPTSTNVSGGAGNDTIYVQTTAGPSHTTVNTGAGTNVVNVGSAGTVNGIAGPLDITGGGIDTVNLDDTASNAPKAGTISATSVTGFSPAAITYAGLTTLNVNLGSGNKNLSVTGTASGTTTNLHDGPGSNTVVVGSLAPSIGGILDGVLANLNITGSGSDSLTLDDSGSSTAKTGTLSSQSLTGLSAGAITYNGTSSLTVNLGSAGDTLTIASTASGTPTTVNAGSGNDTITIQSDASVTTINTGNGTDTVNIQKTGATTNVNTGTGADTVNIGSTAPGNNGVLAFINGTVNVTGGAGGATALNIDDTGRTTASAGMISSGSTTGFSPAAINYSNLSSLTVSLGSGGNTVTIASTPAPTTVNTGGGADTVTLVSTANTTAINSQGGNDNIYVRSTNAATTVSTGAGTDNIIVGSLAPAAGGILDNIQGALTVNGDGNDTLTFDDTGSTAGKTGTLTATTLTGLGMGAGGATYGGIATFNLNLGSGNDNLTVGSTNASTTTNVNSDGGNDSLAIRSTSGITNVSTGSGVNAVTVGSLAPSAGGIIDNIQGALTLTGTGADSLAVDDTGSTSAKTGTLTGTLTGGTLTGLGMGASGIAFSKFITLAINLGLGNDTFNITGTAGLPSPVTTTTSINLGDGNDVLNVTGMGGPATVDGGTGTNTANINVNNFASTLTLIHFAQTNLTTSGLFSGNISTDGNLTGTLNGDDSGTLSAGTVDSIVMPNGHATGTNGQVFQVTQAGVSRAIYAIPNVTNSFKIYYDGVTASVPQAAVQVGTGTTGFDLVLACSSTASRFDLSRVTATGVTSVRNVAVSGNLLNTVTPAQQAYMGGSSAGGVILPSDDLLGVEVRDNLAGGVISAHSIQGVAFATLNGAAASTLNGTLAAGAIASGTTIREGNGVFRVPFGEEAKVELFVDTANDSHLNDVSFNLTDQAVDGRDVTAVMTIASSVSHNQYRVTLTQLTFNGDGGSLDTVEPVSGTVTATGSLGDLMLRSGLAMTSITAGSVIGNIDLFGGSLTGTFQTTGDIGRVIYTNNVPTGVTYINIQLPAGSKLVSRGNLISKVTVGSLGGIIAAQGDIGALVQGTRFGGIAASGVASGADILSLGTIFGDVNISGTVSGRIGAKTKICGNVIIGTLAKGAAVVSGGNIGDATLGTSINIGTFSGFIAAIGTVRNTGKTGTIFQSPLLASDQTAINNIWNSAAAFDAGGSLVGLNTLIAKLNSLTVTGGHLTGT